MEVGPFLAGEVASGDRAGPVQHPGQAYVPAPEPAVLSGDDEVPGAVEEDASWLVGRRYQRWARSEEHTSELQSP